MRTLSRIFSALKCQQSEAIKRWFFSAYLTISPRCSLQDWPFPYICVFSL